MPRRHTSGLLDASQNLIIVMAVRRSIAVLLLLPLLIAVGVLSRHRELTKTTAIDPVAANEMESDGTGRALLSRTGLPPALHVFPIAAFTVEHPTRRRLLDTMVSTAAAKDIAYESIAVHLLRLDNVARSTKDFEHQWIFDDTFALLTDDRQYQRYGTRLPLLVDTPFGVAFRTHPQQDGNAAVTMEMVGGIPHVDKVLSLLGELGYSLETPLTSHSGGHYTVADVLEDSLQRFSYQRELEWSLIAYCDYLGSQHSWRASSGEVVSVSDIVDRLLARAEDRGACRGTHRVYAIAKAHVRELRQPGFLTPDVASRAKDYLHDLSIRLEDCQSPDGSWGPDWNQAGSAVGDAEMGTSTESERMLVTGHMLEWMAVVQNDSRPSQQVIHRAACFVLDRLAAEPGKWFNEQFFPATHALRAIVHLSDASMSPNATERTSIGSESDHTGPGLGVSRTAIPLSRQ
ncbi:MAG: hypothetical protein ACK5Q5_06550 [Planctomycetaceae bacterium]